jgi:hypothetical protein
MTAEPIDQMLPWTIKSVPVRTRDAVTQAARRELLTVGQWLEKRVDEWVANGAPVPIAYKVSDVIELADAAARLASAGDSPVVRTARRALRSALLAAPGMTRAPSVPLLANETGTPDSDDSGRVGGVKP